MLLLRVTYRVRAHHTGPFERVFDEQILPLVRRHQLDFMGIWRTIVGEVGEYMELWQFEDMHDYEERWQGLMQDPELLDIFETTGPMVEEERFTLLSPLS